MGTKTPCKSCLSHALLQAEVARATLLISRGGRTCAMRCMRGGMDARSGEVSLESAMVLGMLSWPASSSELIAPQGVWPDCDPVLCSMPIVLPTSQLGLLPGEAAVTEPGPWEP